MVKKKIKNIVIFGGTSQIAASFVKNYQKKFNITLFSRSPKKIASFSNIKFDFKLNNSNYTKIKKYLINADVIICLAGCFKAKYSSIVCDINLIFYDWLFEKVCNLKKKQKKIITITSLDSIIPNPNSPIYSATKAGLSNLMNSYQLKFKQKVSFSNIICGAVDTKMRKFKKDKNIIQPKDIAQLIKFIIEYNDNIIINNIVMYPKSKTYIKF